MSGAQCKNCGKVGPLSQMALDYQPAFGDCLDPGDPGWAHSSGFGCNLGDRMATPTPGAVYLDGCMEAGGEE